MRSLNTYSLVKALYDEGKDYIDAFWPIAVQCLPHDRSAMAPAPLADAVLRKFGLSIPVHTAHTLLERARRKHSYVARSEEVYRLTAEGLRYVIALESTHNVELRIGLLVEDASKRLSTVAQEFASLQFTQEAIASAIENNSRVFEFATDTPRHTAPSSTAPIEGAVLDYFTTLVAEQSEHFPTLRDLILGSTLTGLLRRDDISDATRHFRPTTLFLDTNVVLSLLGLRFEVECRPAMELLSLLNRTARFTLCVLDITILETVALLRGYSSAVHQFLPGVPVKDLYASLKYRGYSIGDITTLIADIQPRLAAFGVSHIQTGVSLEADDPKWGSLRSTLRSFKQDQDDKGQRHDLHAIAFVKKYRNSDPVRRVEDGKAFLLTEDYRLSNFAFEVGGHRDASTISEVMPDRLLTNLLWLKDPAALAALSIETVIAMHSRDLFIDRRVWNRFSTVLEGLVDEGNLGEEDAAVLLYDAQVQRDLACLRTDEFEAVDDDWLLERLENAQSRQLDMQAEALTAQERALKALHDSSFQSLDEVGQRERSERDRVIRELEGRLAQKDQDESTRKNRLLAEANASARGRAQTYFWVVKLLGVGLVLFGFVKFLPVVERNWNEIEPAVWLLTVVAGLIVVLLGWHYRPDKLIVEVEAEITEWLLRREIAKIESALALPPRTSGTGPTP